ncbi:MAG: GC-type dockerin domain-anchored protein [Phycisphaerales bacterium]
MDRPRPAPGPDHCLRAGRLALGFLAAAGAWAGDFTLLGTHPDAAAQPTSTGRSLHTLQPFNGKIYAGFGDYGANSGPIGIRPFNPGTNTFGGRLLNSGTEAIYIYRPIFGRLYAPHIDPIAGESSGGFAVGTASGGAETWADRFPVTALHLYDMTSYTGSDLWMVGSQGNNATAWRSTDGGTTWSIARQLGPVSASFVRFYGIGNYGGRLYLQSSDRASSEVFDGSSWTAGPNLTPSGGYLWHPGVFAGKLVYKTGHWTSPLRGFDGAQTSIILNPTGSGGGGAGGTPTGIYDYAITDGLIYVLGVDNLVRYSSDLSSWTILPDAAPALARSLTVLDGRLYVGGTNSGLYIYSEPLPPGVCYANCDGSTAAPTLNIADFGCFLQRYAAGEPYANCDGSTNSPVLNVADFGCFLQRFAAGCP